MHEIIRTPLKLLISPYRVTAPMAPFAPDVDESRSAVLRFDLYNRMTAESQFRNPITRDPLVGKKDRGMLGSRLQSWQWTEVVWVAPDKPKRKSDDPRLCEGPLIPALSTRNVHGST